MIMNKSNSNLEQYVPKSIYPPLGPDHLLGQFARIELAHSRSPTVSQSAMDFAFKLQKAIQSGDVSCAMEMAVALAKMQASVSAKLEKSFSSTASEEEISCKVYICDKDLEEQITMKLYPTVTIETLKTMMFQKHHFLPEHQKWIIGKRLARDMDTLTECGVTFSGAVLFLYLLTPKDSNESNVRLTDMQGGGNTRHSNQNNINVAATMSSLPAIPMNIQQATPSFLATSGRISTELYGNVVTQPTSSPPVEEKIRWECPKCTFLNEPTRPGCEMCTTEKPTSYVIPLNYRPTEDRRNRMEYQFENTAEGYDTVDRVSSSDELDQL